MTVIWEPQWTRGWYVFCVNVQIVCLSSGWVEAVGGKDTVVLSDGGGGMVATTKKKITILSNDNVLKVGGERVEWILMEVMVMLEYANVVLSGVKRFADIDCSSAVLVEL